MMIVNNKGELWYNKICYKSCEAKAMYESKKEGDGCTPIGTFHINKLFLREDRIKTIITKIKTIPIVKNMAWEDNPRKKNYNKLITLSKNSHRERLYRKDHLYDLILVVEYNTKKIIKGKGSAIFIHIAKPKYKPTQGCDDAKKDFLNLLKKIKRKEKIKIIG